ncbi:MAG TPA: LamG domain-containing protein, partial [Puia sp.]|nr:LamG domain-containing protein [Puia sp.]
MIKYLLIPAIVFIFLRTDGQNYSLTFNGSSQYVNIANQASLSLSANFTIEGWIYPTGAGSDPTQGGIIINKESSYEVARFADGSLQYAMSANGAGTDWSWINTGLVAPLNVWTHFALVKSGTNVTFYFNASKSYSNASNPATLTANAQALRIAARTSGAQYFQGNIDEVRIWNIARVQSDLKANMFNRNLSNGATGLIAYYRMNENGGTTTANSSTNTTGIDGTLVNSPTWTASPVQFGTNALSFDGINDFVSIAEDNSLDITSAITLEAWVYAIKNTGGIQDVVSKSNNTTNTGYIFPRTDDNWAHVVAYLYIGGWKTFSVPYASLNAWHHLAFTYDGATMKIYIDGVLAGSQVQTGTIAINSNVLALGTQPGFPENFGGSADEIRIWNIARTQTQIQSAMNAEIDPTTQTGLVSYYNMDQGIAAGTNTGLTTLVDQKGNNNGTLTNMALTSSTSNFVVQNS